MFPRSDISRRLFLAIGASSFVAACSKSTSDEQPTTSFETSSTLPNSTQSTMPSEVELPSSTSIAPPIPYSQPGWLAIENAQAGTDSWRIDFDIAPTKRLNMTGFIEGYADTTSAQSGQVVNLYVNTGSPQWHLEAYRMGYYGGLNARLIWTSETFDQPWQFAEPSFDRETRMHTAQWSPSTAITIDDSWPPGSYLLKLNSSEGGAHYIPLTIRRDDCAASLVVVSAVTTWQAYNPWGGRSLYENFGPGSRFDRSLVVSFDRPYASAYNWGSADFLTHELPLISLIEELGIDTAYVSDIDLHTSALDGDGSLNPVLLNRTALLTTGHDEYYSTPMRATLERARDAGINLAFFGANAVYRHIRLEPNSENVPNRQLVNYRTADIDPMTAVDPQQATVQWRNAPLNQPESALIGVQYFAAGITASMKLVNTDNWVFNDVDLSMGRTMKRLVAIEADGLGPSSSEPSNLEVLASSPVMYKDSLYNHAMTYYSADSGAGVFATGTIGWINALDITEWGDEAVSTFVRGVTTNVLQAFAAGPTGLEHPSVGNASRYRSSVQAVVEN